MNPNLRTNRILLALTAPLLSLLAVPDAAPGTPEVTEASIRSSSHAAELPEAGSRSTALPKTEEPLPNAPATDTAPTTAGAGPEADTDSTSTSTGPTVGRSPWGPDDELGSLNRMNDASRAAVLARIAGGRVYDLGVEYFVGMPSWHLLGDPRYQYWLTHTPRGTAVDDPAGVGHVQNELVSYTGDAVSFYTHMGTHIDALNHFGLNGEVYNGFHADEHLGDRGWTKTGAETIPPIIARGVLIDVAGAKGVESLPDSYGITAEDLQAALCRQAVELEPGDVVLIRGGRMLAWPSDDGYVMNQPGLGLDAAKWLAEEREVLAIGGDNLSLEHFPVADDSKTWVPVHTYLLAQAGVPIIEVVDLEELARDGVYEFAFIAASLKFRGASAAPFRPIALPLR